MSAAAQLEAFLTKHNAPAEFRTFVQNANLTSLREIGALAANDEQLIKTVFPLLGLQAIQPDFTKTRVKQNKSLSPYQMVQAEKATRVLITEKLNSREVATLTQAIETTLTEALECWAMTPEGNKTQRDRTRDRDSDARAKRERDRDSDREVRVKREHLADVREAYAKLPDKARPDKWQKERNGEEICKNYQIGKCSRGRDCKFLHECALPTCAGKRHMAKDCRA